MPRGPGGLYRSLAMKVNAAWRAQIRGRAGIEIVEIPSLKEIHIVVGREAFSFKIAERQWYTTPALLLRYARSLLRHSKERARSAKLILLLPGSPGAQ